MADIHPRRNKKGELISFGIRVYHGYDRFGNRIKPSCTTSKANPEWSEKKNRTECEKFANRFEEQCKMGFNLTHGITFSEYADYVIRLKESTGVKHTTILSYRGLLKRINPGIGHLKITEFTRSSSMTFTVSSEKRDLDVKAERQSPRKTCEKY